MRYPHLLCEQKMCLKTRATHSQTVTHMLMFLGPPQQSERTKSRDMHQWVIRPPFKNHRFLSKHQCSHPLVFVVLAHFSFPYFSLEASLGKVRKPLNLNQKEMNEILITALLFWSRLFKIRFWNHPTCSFFQNLLMSKAELVYFLWLAL